MPSLLDEFSLKSLNLKNRIVMAPMCQYSAVNGVPNDWHFVHYTSRAIGGAGLVMMEMTNVEPDGRITEGCLGIWSEEHMVAFAKIVKACQGFGAKVGMQIAHAGRKAEHIEVTVSPSSEAFSEKYKTPRALSTLEVKEMVKKFERGFRYAIDAGVDTIEIHGAHGYLIHQFHSPLINKRHDEYGKDLSLFGVEVIQAAKRAAPENMPIIMRISAREYTEGGYGVDHILSICEAYKKAGVDMFHISSGGEGAAIKGMIEVSPGYQVSLAERVKKELNVPVIAVGALQDPLLAESILQQNQADLVAIGRGMLRSPYWANEASMIIKEESLTPKQYAAAYTLK